MPLSVGCPRCSAPLARVGDDWVCVEHGTTEPLWRPSDPSYTDFADHLRTSRSFPTYLPWPLSPGWHVTDFAAVGEARRGSRDDDLLLGHQRARRPGRRAGGDRGGRHGSRRPDRGHGYDDPGAEVGQGPPGVRVRIDRQVVPLWPVSTSQTNDEWDRSVVVGEALGRWLWLVLRPASAMLLLRDDWILRDASLSGPHLVELPFGGPAPTW